MRRHRRELEQKLLEMRRGQWIAAQRLADPTAASSEWDADTEGDRFKEIVRTLPGPG
jgi:hypothetical protein